MKRVTIIDVANAAGVSRQTVSRAMNGKAEISPQTKERVMQAVAELGYRPNRVAQSMVTRRTFTVGLIFTDILNPFFPEVARGVQDIAREHNYNVFLCNTDDDPKIEMSVLRSLASQPVDGIIILGSSISDDELKTFADEYSPIVVTNRFVDHPKINLLIVDNIRGGELAAGHFVSKGHQHVGMITSSTMPISIVRRAIGFRNALDQHGLPNDDDIFVQAAPTITGGYEATKQLLADRPNTTGIFAYNDLMALGAIRACHDLNLSIPEDISIIGFDDIHLTSIVTPALTSVRVDKYAIGEKAFTRLLKMMEHQDKEFADIKMPVELVVRESTRA